MAIDDRSIQQAAEGNRSAQEVLFRSLVDRVHRLVLRIVGPADADDVTQEVFIRILRSLESYRGKAAFTTWVHRVTINEALQFLRRKKRSPQTISLEENNPSIVRATELSQSDSLEQHETFELAFAQLHPEQRALLELREVYQQSYAEIAEILEIPAGTVGSRLNKARNDLQRQLQTINTNTPPTKTP